MQKPNEKSKLFTNYKRRRISSKVQNRDTQSCQYLVPKVVSLDHAKSIQRYTPNRENQSAQSNTNNNKGKHYYNKKTDDFSRGLDEWQTQNILAESVLDLPVHILTQRGEIDSNVLRCGRVLSHLKDSFLCLVVTDGKGEEVDAVGIGRQWTEKACKRMIK